MVKFVVLMTYGKENVLGYIDSDQPNVIGILASSVIKGATLSWHDGWTYVPSDLSTVRAATVEDFKTFNVSVDGYLDNKRYEQMN